jgi:hypothetical protein
MDTYLIAAIIVLVVAVGLLIFSFLRPNFQEILIGIALLIGTAGGVFLSEHFIKNDQIERDKVAAWADIRRYAMSEVLLPYADMDNLVKQLSSSKSVNETSEYLSKLPPLPVYDRLLRDSQLVNICDGPGCLDSFRGRIS